MSYGITNLRIYIEHPEVELDDEVYVTFKWYYYKGQMPSFTNDEFYEAEFGLDIIDYEAPHWVTKEMIEDKLYSLTIEQLTQ